MTDTSQRQFLKQGEMYFSYGAYGHLAEDYNSPRKSDETGERPDLLNSKLPTHKQEGPSVILAGERGLFCSHLSYQNGHKL